MPVIASVTIPDRSGRTLSGQTLEAFYNSISHNDLLAVSINCALGADDMRPYVEELSRLTSLPTACYPNAGLPNEFGGYDDTPDAHGGAAGRVRARPAGSTSSAAAAAPGPSTSPPSPTRSTAWPRARRRRPSATRACPGSSR